MAARSTCCVATKYRRQCRRWVTRDRCSRSCQPVHVRFGPKATYIRRCREMTRMDGPAVLPPQRTRRVYFGVFAEHEEHTMPRKTDTAVVSTIGIDTGKNALHMVGLDERGAIVLREKVSRP